MVVILLGLGLFLFYMTRRSGKDQRSAETAVTQPRESELASSNDASGSLESDPKSDLQRQQETEALLQSADADILLQHLQSLKDQSIPLKKAEQQFNDLNRVIKHLNSISLTAGQRIHLKAIEIDVGLWVHAFKDKIDVNIDVSKMNIRDIANELSQDEDVQISAAAHAALMAIDAIDLSNDGSEETFLKFIDSYSRHISYAIQGDYGVKSTGRLLPGVLQLNPGDERCIALQEDFIVRTAESPSALARNVGIAFKEHVYFSHVQLQTLIANLRSSGEIAAFEVDQLYARLKQHPDVSQTVFRYSLVVIKTLIEGRHFELAENAIAKLREIQPSIINAETRELVTSQLTAYEKNVVELRPQE